MNNETIKNLAGHLANSKSIEEWCLLALINEQESATWQGKFISLEDKHKQLEKDQAYAINSVAEFTNFIFRLAGDLSLVDEKLRNKGTIIYRFVKILKEFCKEEVLINLKGK